MPKIITKEVVEERVVVLEKLVKAYGEYLDKYEGGKVEIDWERKMASVIWYRNVYAMVNGEKRAFPQWTQRDIPLVGEDGEWTTFNINNRIINYRDKLRKLKIDYED